MGIASKPPPGSSLGIFEYFFKFLKINFRSFTRYQTCIDSFTLGIAGREFDIMNFVDVLETIKKLSRVEWFRNQSATWNEKFQPQFAEIWTTRGIGFVFNSIDGEDLLNYEE